MTKTLVISENNLFIQSLKSFTKNISQNFLIENESILDSSNELAGFCKKHNVENIILFENSEFCETDFIIQQKRYMNLYEILDLFEMNRFINYIDINKTNFQNVKILTEKEIMTESDSVYGLNKSLVLKNNKIYNKFKKTKCLTLIHGDLYGKESSASKVSFYIKKFLEAKEIENPCVEIEENANNEYQLTYIDNLVDITLFFLFEKEKINSIENLVWNIATPELIKIKDLIFYISYYNKNTKIIFNTTNELEEQRFLSTDKFISEFVQYPYIKLQEALKIILTN